MSEFTDKFVLNEPHDTESNERFLRLIRMVHKMLLTTFYEDDEYLEYMRSKVFNNREEEYIDSELMVSLVEAAATVEEYDYPIIGNEDEIEIVDAYTDWLANIAASFLNEDDEEWQEIIFH